jgi:hypothetical protein
MPIKGLTDVSNTFEGLVKIGKLFKGTEQREHTNGKGETKLIMGKDLDHFRMEFEPEHEWARETWLELYGDNPTKFDRVFLAAQSVEEVLESWWMEDWNGSGTLLHRCDGEQQVKWWQESTGTYNKAKIACASDTQKGCHCKETARLTLIIPELWDALGIPCVVEITTHSKYDIIALKGHLALIQKMYGGIAGVPFVFGRSDREVSVPNPKDTTKRIKVTKSLLYIRVTSDFTRNQLLPALAPSAPSSPAVVDSDGVILDGAAARQALGSSETHRIGGGVDFESALQKQGDEPETEVFTCNQLLVLPHKKEFQYVVKCVDGKTNLITYSQSVFTEAGFDTSTWTTNVESSGKLIQLNPPIQIEAQPNGKGGWVPLKVLGTLTPVDESGIDFR